MIRSRLNILIAEKEARERRKLIYRTICDETGLSPGALVRLAKPEIDRVDGATLSRLCRFFGVRIGDLLEYIPDEGNGPDESNGETA